MPRLRLWLWIAIALVVLLLVGVVLQGLNQLLWQLSYWLPEWLVGPLLLVVVAVEVIVLSLPALLLGEGEANTHEARHLGAFTVAYGVALLVVAFRPARARTILPVAAVLAGALLITAVVDLLNGKVPLLEEATHLPELVSVVLVWLLAAAPLRRDRHTQPTADAALRLVEPGDAPEQSVG